MSALAPRGGHSFIYGPSKTSIEQINASTGTVTYLHHDQAGSPQPRRVYDPATAQFLSVDPLAAITRAPYTYASDNLINDADPTGLCNANPFSGSFWTKGNCISESPLNPIPYYE